MERLNTFSKYIVDEKIKEGKLDYLALSGSVTYGTNIETSDLDVRGILFPNKYELLSLMDNDKVIDENNDLDLVLKPFKLELQSLMKCNPNVLELLSVKDEYILFIGEKGRLLRNNIDLFLTSEKVYSSYVGYSYGEIANWEKAKEKRDYTKANKCLMNALRILYEGRDILLKKGVNPYREVEREYLLEVRQGHHLSEVVMYKIKELQEEMKLLKEISLLPSKLDTKKVYDLVYKINSLE